MEYRLVSIRDSRKGSSAAVAVRLALIWRRLPRLPSMIGSRERRKFRESACDVPGSRYPPGHACHRDEEELLDGDPPDAHGTRPRGGHAPARGHLEVHGDGRTDIPGPDRQDPLSLESEAREERQAAASGIGRSPRLRAGRAPSA